MMAKSEIALLTVTVLGTLAAGLAGQHPSLVTPDLRHEPSIACSVPASAFRGGQAVLRRRESIVRSSIADVPCVSVTSADGYATGRPSHEPLGRRAVVTSARHV